MKQKCSMAHNQLKLQTEVGVLILMRGVARTYANMCTCCVVHQFQTQQIYCVRDRDGNITEGAKVCILPLKTHNYICRFTVLLCHIPDAVVASLQDEIHTVHYAWAMQQVLQGEMQEFDVHRRWKLREMQQLGIQALI